MPITKGSFCAGCPLEKSGHGFVQITAPRNYDTIKLLVQGDMPTYDDTDDGKPFSGKIGWWLKHNWLGNAGVTEAEVIADNTLRCRPYTKKGSPYPKKKTREAAEAHCRHYSIWSQVPSSIPLLCISDEAAMDQMGVDSVATWHGHIAPLEDGRLGGITYHPASVMKQPNLLPLVIKETQNLMEAAQNPAVLTRPEVVKGIAPYKRGQEAVVDLEWAYDKKTKQSGDINIVGIAYEGTKSYATYDVSAGIETVREHFENGTRIIGHNFIDADLPKLGLEPKSFHPDHLIDTMIVAHLIHPHWSELGLFGLEDLVRFYRPTTAWKHDKSDLLLYNGYDTAYNFRLWEDLQIDLSLTDQWHLVEKDQRLAHMAVLMHQKGLRIDSEGLRRFQREWNARREEIAKAFPFNPRSPKQVLAYFAEQHIRLSATDIETLEKAYKRKQHPVLEALIEYKNEGKGLKSWYSDAAIELGRIYPKFNVTGTAVARFSSSGPNAQNIPPEYRRFILPFSDDEFIASFDGKNIEGRTCAWNANDDRMLADFASGLDIHTLVSSRILNKRMEDISKDERQAGKRTVHASNYLETPFNLATRLYGDRRDESIRKAERFQEGYFGAYPKTREWQRELEEQMNRGDIMLRNPFGRVRMIYAQNGHERAKRACHFLGCSTGAEVVNQRALDVWDAFGLLPMGIVHDELFYSLPKGDKGERLVQDIRRVLDAPIPEMDGFVIPFGYKSGPNYGELHEEE